MKINTTPTIKEVNEALENSYNSIVIYTSKDGTDFILNPFGGGISKTQELILESDFKVSDENITRIVIVNTK